MSCVFNLFSEKNVDDEYYSELERLNSCADVLYYGSVAARQMYKLELAKSSAVGTTTPKYRDISPPSPNFYRGRPKSVKFGLNNFDPARLWATLILKRRSLSVPNYVVRSLFWWHDWCDIDATHLWSSKPSVMVHSGHRLCCCLTLSLVNSLVISDLPTLSMSFPTQSRSSSRSRRPWRSRVGFFLGRAASPLSTSY